MTGEAMLMVCSWERAGPMIQKWPVHLQSKAGVGVKQLLLISSKHILPLVRIKYRVLSEVILPFLRIPLPPPSPHPFPYSC